MHTEKHVLLFLYCTSISMCVYDGHRYICILLCVYVVYTCIDRYACTCMCIEMYLCVYMYMYAYGYVFVFVCVYVYVCVKHTYRAQLLPQSIHFNNSSFHSNDHCHVHVPCGIRGHLQTLVAKLS